MSDYISRGNFRYHNETNSGVSVHLRPGVKKITTLYGFLFRFLWKIKDPKHGTNFDVSFLFFSCQAETIEIYLKTGIPVSILSGIQYKLKGFQ